MRLAWILTLAALLLAGCARHATRPHGFAEPRAGLYTGGQPDAAALRGFAEAGGALVIDLRTGNEARGLDEPALARELGLRYASLPIGGADDLTASNAARLHELLAGADGPVLLHCASGNRVGALLAIDAVQNEGADPAAALELGRRAGLGSLEPAVRERLEAAPGR